MIFLITALSFEAKPLITHFHLSKQEGSLPVFSAGEITLLVTGSGPMNAASHTAACLSRFELTPSDFLINIGICASLDPGLETKPVLIHKLSDLSSDRDYYPDLLCTSLREEARLLSGAKVFRAEESDLPLPMKDTVYDMEGAAVYHAGSLFFGPHQMRFIKLISDYGRDFPSPKEISALMQEFIPMLEEEIEAMKTQCFALPKETIDTEAVEDLFLPSASMRRQIHQLILYCTLAGISWQVCIERCRNEGLLPAENREEGKKRLEELRNELLA